MNAPIIIFSYNRPKHLNNLINSLIKNKTSEISKIFFFVMAPKMKKIKKKLMKLKIY